MSLIDILKSKWRYGFHMYKSKAITFLLLGKIILGYLEKRYYQNHMWANHEHE